MAELEQLFGFFFPPDQPIAILVNFTILAVGLVSLGLLALEGLRRLRRDVGVKPILS